MLNRQKQAVNIENIEPNKLQDIFLSEEYFWLITALAAACAEEELEGYILPKGLGTKEISEMFNQMVRFGMIEEERLDVVRKNAWDKICTIAAYSNTHPIFDKKRTVAVSKAFIGYWLIFQLIQSQWQEKLNMSELSDTYNFLDGLLFDGAELEKIEEKLSTQELLDDDEEIYLRSNWKRVRKFWENLYEEIFLRLLQREETRGMIC